MSNSPLVSYTKLSPNHSGRRTHTVDRITPHCVEGQCSVETLGDIFAPTSRKASCQYGIGPDGRVGMYVEEKNRSWCSSSNANDQRAITIECASDKNPPYAFKSTVYNRLIDLCVDICQRYGKTKLLWFGDKNKTLNYNPAPNEMVLTVHRWFANKSCPGDWLYSRMDDLATKVTARLNSQNTGTKVNYKVKVTAKEGLNCRMAPTTDSSIVSTYKKDTVLAVTKESRGWGYTGRGWVLLAYTAKINEDKGGNKMSKGSAWAQASLDWVKKNGIMTGDEKGNMMPLEACTREEIAVMLKRLYDLINSGKTK